MKVDKFLNALGFERFLFSIHNFLHSNLIGTWETFQLKCLSISVNWNHWQSKDQKLSFSNHVMKVKDSSTSLDSPWRSSNCEKIQRVCLCMRLPLHALIPLPSLNLLSHHYCQTVDLRFVQLSYLPHTLVMSPKSRVNPFGTFKNVLTNTIAGTTTIVAVLERFKDVKVFRWKILNGSMESPDSTLQLVMLIYNCLCKCYKKKLGLKLQLK